MNNGEHTKTVGVLLGLTVVGPTVAGWAVGAGVGQRRITPGPGENTGVEQAAQHPSYK